MTDSFPSPPLDLQKLREIAQRATQGRWFWRDNTMMSDAPGHPDDMESHWDRPDGEHYTPPTTIIETDSGYYPPRENDAAHIAEWYPERCLQLLDELERLRKELRICVARDGRPLPAELRSSGAPVGATRREAVALISAERERQVAKEGWTLEHDDGHTGGEIAITAAVYASPWPLRMRGDGQEWFDPIEAGSCWVKDHPRLRQLVIAGALIVAEIERLQRVKGLEHPNPLEGK